ncbi:MAG: hypothetical protein ACW98K_00610 [Candidatus Kariarchaeaceae archaeon]
METDLQYPSVDSPRLNDCPKCKDSNEPEALYCGKCGLDLRKFAKINYARTRKRQKQMLRQPVTDVSSAVKLVIGTNLITIAGFFFVAFLISGIEGVDFRSLMLIIFLVAAPLSMGYTVQKQLLTFSEMLGAAFINFFAILGIGIVYFFVTRFY